MTARFWLSYIARSLRRSGRRTAFALLCVVVGVAGVVALQTASLTIQNTLTSNVRAANGGDISVTTQATPLSTRDLAVFRRLQRIGRISAWSAVATMRATSVGTSHHLVPFNVDIVQTPPYPIGGQPTFVTPGNGNVAALLRRSGDVLVTSELADELGMHVGSRLLVQSIGGAGLHGTIRGILAETDFSHSTVMTVEKRDTSLLAGHSLQYGAVYVNTPGSADAVAGLLRARFPVATVQTVQQALQADEQQVHDFRQFMLLVALLALLIAGIGILNAMQSMLTWRRLEIAMLKAIGFREATLYKLFGGEAFTIGLIGGVLGTAIGAGVSKFITDALARALALQVNFEIDAGTLLSGIVLGIGTTLVFAVLPIVRAANLRPLEILREGAGAALASHRWLQTVLLVALILVLFVVLASVTLQDTTVALEFVGGAFGAFLALAGGFALTARGLGRLGPPASRASGVGILLLLLALTALAAFRVTALAAILALASLLWLATVVLPEGRLLPLLIAARSLSRRTGRTAMTLVAFLAGVLAMTLTLTVALNLQNQINSILSSRGNANLVALAGAGQEARVARAAHKLPGVQHLSFTTLASINPLAVNGRSLASVIGPAPTNPNSDEADDRGRLLGSMSGYDLQRGAGPSSVELVVGRMLGPRDAGTSNIVARAGLEDPPYNLTPGDTLTLRGSGTGVTRTVRVVGFYARPRRTRGFGSFFVAPLLADRSLTLTLGGADAQTVATFSINPNLVSQDATTLQQTLPGALVVNVNDLTAIVERILNELLNVLAVITALVLGAGVAVVANGVTLAMFERRREIALFKAIGFGPRSALQFVMIENALIGTLAGAVSVLVVAIALGVLSRLALQQAIGFDPWLAILILVVATALAVVTAYLAARTPIRVRPLEALRNE